MSQIRILFLSHRFYPFVGGIEVNSEILANNFHEAGHSIRLMTWTNEKGTKDFDFEVIRNPSTLELIKHHLWADLVFENNPCYRLAWPMIFTASKSVIAIRTKIMRPSGELGIQDKFKFRHIEKADGVIAVSTAIRDECWKDAEVIPNPYRNHIFKNLGLANRSDDFVFLGRLVSQKRCDLAISLVSRLKENGADNAILTIIGDGPEMESLKAQVVENNLEENVIFLGELKGDKLVKELNRHKYMLIPSEWEAFGNVALEGIACGNIPIVSDSGGLVDAVGDAGIVFKSADLDSFENEVLGLLANPDKIIDLLGRQTEHLRTHEPKKIASRYLEVIEKLFFNN